MFGAKNVINGCKGPIGLTHICEGRGGILGDVQMGGNLVPVEKVALEYPSLLIGMGGALWATTEPNVRIQVAQY